MLCFSRNYFINYSLFNEKGDYMNINKIIALSLSLMVFLTACENVEATSEFPSYDNGYDRSQTIMQPASNAGHGAPVYLDKQSNLPSGVTQPTTFMSEINDVFWPLGWDALNSWETELTEVQKLLVVPVSFKDTRKKATEDIRQDISKTFFGKASDTGWESVASYYYKSSRGQLTLTGEVTPWINLGTATTELKNSSQIEDLVIKKIYDTLPGEMLQEYDLNQDGWLDALWIVYAADIQQNNNETFWAFVSWVNAESNMDKPYPGVFGWTSYEFMYEGGNAGLPQFKGDEGKLLVDSHTFVHETGHMLGLTDYYDYDSETNPSGGVDMMGNNIIDHNAYSKFLLHWNQPLIPNAIQEETTIRLRPAAQSGDFILLNPEWNGSVFDEYILLEYYTVEGLNEKDSRVRYQTDYSSAVGHNQPGVRVWHVDSTLWAGPIRNNWFTYDYEVTPQPGDVYADVKDVNTHAVYFGASNTTSEGRDEDFDLLKLLDASGAGSYYNSYRANSSNSSLFQPGDEITDWNKYLKNGTGKFNSGNDIGFTVSFGAMDANGIQVTLTKTI